MIGLFSFYPVMPSPSFNRLLLKTMAKTEATVFRGGQIQRSPFTQRGFILLCLSALLFFVSNNLLAPILPLFFQAKHFTLGETGTLVALFMLASMVMRPVAGWLSDNYPHKPLMVFSLLAYIVCQLCYAILPDSSLVGFWALRIINGLTFGLFYTVSYTTLLGLIPPDRKAEGIGYYSNAVKVAMAFSPMLGLWLANHQHLVLPFGLASLMSVLCLLAILGMPPRAYAQSLAQATVPEALRPKGFARWFNLKAVFPGVLMATNSAVFGALIPFIPLMMSGLHHESHSADYAQWFYPLYAISLIVSRSLTGPLSDRYGRAQVLVPGMAAVSIALVVMAACATSWWFLVATVFYGLAAGTVQPSLLAMTADRATEGEQGSATATFTLLSDFGIGLGGWLMGAVGEHYGYINGLYVMAGITLLGTIAMAVQASGLTSVGQVLTSRILKRSL